MSSMKYAYFTTTDGVHQGSCLSTLFCNLYLAFMEREWEKEWNAMLGTNESTPLTTFGGGSTFVARLVDDYLVITDNPLFYLFFFTRLSTANSTLKKWGLSINKNKFRAAAGPPSSPTRFFGQSQEGGTIVSQLLSSLQTSSSDVAANFLKMFGMSQMTNASYASRTEGECGDVLSNCSCSPSVQAPAASQEQMPIFLSPFHLPLTQSWISGESQRGFSTSSAAHCSNALNSLSTNLSNGKFKSRSHRQPKMHSKYSIKWCGLVLNSKTLEWQKDQHSLKARAVLSYYTRPGRRPVATFLSTLTTQLSLLFNPLLLDATINSYSRVVHNVKAMLFVISTKTAALIRSLKWKRKHLVEDICDSIITNCLEVMKKTIRKYQLNSYFTADVFENFVSFYLNFYLRQQNAK
ncbi:uncharacterized protein MONOS_7316 [Monocercomonoides exilis]|uniref:uncharacterized protein n=1 Tax=Monocercomonoides exilis TaxID=2049356 RepID=UPI00355A4CEB|nr:hypothetical protein MONOS_7316 [Monocercomonoides exilis]|eukprot:MONOS_7316.1-p1 / transcript=MONOS_7316.1 / gene=MONOS_7316 / organism=Monocercomonoides_exilis_PA203 / gene_product=unspecified product / transcript_product=unspecified product / location=Mono_scaffold00247:53618-55101(-) / protein_length=406 / sequence_SO=supercontig / SO=protein_coding / is_pseudo=false